MADPPNWLFKYLSQLPSLLPAQVEGLIFRDLFLFSLFVVMGIPVCKLWSIKYEKSVGGFWGKNYFPDLKAHWQLLLFLCIFLLPGIWISCSQMWQFLWLWSSKHKEESQHAMDTRAKRKNPGPWRHSRTTKVTKCLHWLLLTWRQKICLFKP